MCKIRKGTSFDKSQIEKIALKAYKKYVDLIGKKPAPMVADFLKHLNEDFVSKSASTIQLYTNEKMYENIDWYKRIGYSEFKRKTVDGFERVYFIKEL
ncbi:hypothetical protein N9I56_05710 [Alphaproteobacteria bacterium]|nr:hypothetical protein [Alphaproteobacteria bacterium]